VNVTDRAMLPIVTGYTVCPATRVRTHERNTMLPVTIGNIGIIGYRNRPIAASAPDADGGEVE